MMNENNIEQIPTQQINSSHELNFFSEIDHFSQTELQTLLEQLNQLCQEFDPYAPKQLSPEVASILKDLDLEKFLANPFTFTNTVLKILTKVESKLKTFK